MRLLGILTLAAAASFFVSVPLDAASPSLSRGLRIAGLLMLVPAALALERILAPRHRAVVWGATAAGIASLVWWSLSGIVFPWSWEPGYIALSALWWLGIGWAIRPRRRRFGTFTVVVGAFAAVDAVLTAAGDAVPFWLFALFGGPKLPLQVAWTVWLGIELFHGRIRPGANRAEEGAPRW